MAGFLHQAEIGSFPLVESLLFNVTHNFMVECPAVACCDCLLKGETTCSIIAISKLWATCGQACLTK